MTNDPELLIKFGRKRLDERQFDELVGLAAGITADGVVNQQEAELLLTWLTGYGGLVNDNPLVRPILYRIREMLADNVLDDEEAQELLEILKGYSGATFDMGELAHATSLPIDNPPPIINFAGERFCFTGTFAFGGRKDCEMRTKELGGESGSLTRKTNFLVIGTYVTETWKHASYGLKIMRAVEMQEKGASISIVDESHWDAEYRKHC